jgi:hypothetical protein
MTCERTTTTEGVGKDAMAVIRQLSLVKGTERFVFRYQAGQEADVIDAFASLANDQGSAFDWFDAAVLSYQMGRRLEMELDHIATSSRQHER